MESVHFLSSSPLLRLNNSDKHFQKSQTHLSLRSAGCCDRIQLQRTNEWQRNKRALWSSRRDAGAPRHSEEFAEIQASDDKLSQSSSFKFWNGTTEKLAGSATFAFLLLQLPQTILNAQNLMAGNKTALFAVSWMSLLTSLFGNLSLLSYFAMKKENGAAIVQAVGVFATYVVLVQLAIAGSMPSPIFIATSIAVSLGYIVNFLNYKSLLSDNLWKLWQDTISIGGVSILSQVMWSTFEPFLPHSLAPGIVASIFGFSLIVLERRGKLPDSLHKLVGGLAAWSATLLFMWSPIAQMWMNISNPENLKGLSVLSILLAMIGNSLLLPRALFIRDFMWFIGSSWGALLQGWGLLLSMYIYRCVSGPAFFLITSSFILWLGNMLLMDSRANRLNSMFSPLVQLLRGERHRESST